MGNVERLLRPIGRGEDMKMRRREDGLVEAEISCDALDAALASLEAADLNCPTYAIVVDLVDRLRLIGSFPDPISAFVYGEHWCELLDAMNPDDPKTTFRVHALHTPQEG